MWNIVHEKKMLEENANDKIVNDANRQEEAVLQVENHGNEMGKRQGRKTENECEQEEVMGNSHIFMNSGYAAKNMKLLEQIYFISLCVPDINGSVRRRSSANSTMTPPIEI